jgi:hypothetical protein
MINPKACRRVLELSVDSECGLTVQLVSVSLSTKFLSRGGDNYGDNN